MSLDSHEISAAQGLPIARHKREITEALTQHSVVLVTGETGSGKSTQLPQYLLELGFQCIAHTQPRRIAARALAARIASEVSSEPVGYKVRFDQSVKASTRLILMTDGVLLAEASADPGLKRYDALIIDEAHERSLNIDLLLGLIKRLVTRRPALRAIITSATVEVDRMARFFSAPAIRVEGSSFPVEIRYRPCVPAAGGEPDLPAAVRDGCLEYLRDPDASGGGNILVFLPGERQIVETQESLCREATLDMEVLPLHSRMSWESQIQALEPTGHRRVILATNVAETSLTVPGVRCVIDTGLARISRFNPGDRLQQLAIEPISRASAQQRAGRCGRIGPGLCVRLYSREDFDARPAFTDPEVLRTHLAGLILRLLAERLGSPEDFPFLDAPIKRALSSGYRTLTELQAIDAQGRLTAIGKRMARLPIDPHIARALIESERFGAVRELLIIGAALSVPEAQTAQGNRRPADFRRGITSSDFVALLARWDSFHAVRNRSRRSLSTWCRRRGLSLSRMREWQSVHDQLAERSEPMGIVARDGAASFANLHRALLAGFFMSVGKLQDRNVYQGTKGGCFVIHPGSHLAKRPPEWVMAAKLARTSRVFGRFAARVEPAWIEAAAHGVVTRDYYDADWDDGRAEVLAKERVVLSGLTLIAGRAIRFGNLFPADARSIFIREGLVHRRLRPRPAWLLADDCLLDGVAPIEERLRIKGLGLSEAALLEHYASLIPDCVWGGASLDTWSKAHASLERSLPTAYSIEPTPRELGARPERVNLFGTEIAVSYRFAPGANDDGATLRVPLLLMPALTRSAVAAAIPAYELPRALATLKALPKASRVALHPLQTTAQSFVEESRAVNGTLSLAVWLRERRGVEMPPGAREKLDTYLDPLLIIIDEGREIARGRQVRDLRAATAHAARTAADAAACSLFPGAWNSFVLQALPLEVQVPSLASAVSLHPALEETASAIRVNVFCSDAEASHAHHRGVVALARAALPALSRGLAKRIQANSRLLLLASAWTQGADLVDALSHTIFHHLMGDAAASLRSCEGFGRAIRLIESRAPAQCVADLEYFESLFLAANALRAQMAGKKGASEAHVTSIRSHLDALLHPARWRDAPWNFVQHFARYVKAAGIGFERDPKRRFDSWNRVEAWQGEFDRMRRQSASEFRWHPDLEMFEWMIEEYRCAMNAQELKTAMPVSEARLARQRDRIDAWFAA